MPLKREEVEAWLKRHGYSSRPIYPHIFYRNGGVPEQPERADRYRLTQHGLRRESRISSGEWVRARSAYFKNLSLTPDDKLSGMSMRGM